MLFSTLLVGAQLMCQSATPITDGDRALDFGPEGPIVSAVDGKAKLPESGFVELVGVGEASHAKSRAWDALGKPLKGESRRLFDRALAESSPGAILWTPGAKAMVAVFRVQPSATSIVDLIPPARAMFASRAGNLLVNYFEAKAGTRSVKGRYAAPLVKAPWHIVGFFSLDGKSSVPGLFFRELSRQEDIRSHKVALTISALLPLRRDTRQREVVPCQSDAIPAGTALVNRIGHPVHFKQVETAVFSLLLNLEPAPPKVFRLEARPRAIAELTIPLQARR